jgi:hypothetical protein
LTVLERQLAKTQTSTDAQLIDFQNLTLKYWQVTARHPIILTPKKFEENNILY